MLNNNFAELNDRSVSTTKMNRYKGFSFLSLVLGFTIVLSANVSAQLINEIEIDPPSVGSDACQYVELLGTAGASVQANTYFLSVNSDAGNFGFANQAVNVGGQTFGSNGTLVLFNTSFGECPNRTYGAGTTRMNYFNPLRIGTGSEAYLIVRSTTTLSSGQDLDVNNDGVFDPALGITVLDGFALLVNPEEEWVYGAVAGVVNISNVTTVDQPDAVTRIAGNTTPFVSSAFYFGELAATPDETLEYATPRSANFPTGGILTPGSPNAPASSAAGSISGRVTTPAGLALRNAIVILTNAQGVRRTAVTSPFGLYTFTDVAIGGSYTVSVTSKRYRFSPRTLAVAGTLTDIDFVGIE